MTVHFSQPVPSLSRFCSRTVLSVSILFFGLVFSSFVSFSSFSELQAQQMLPTTEENFDKNSPERQQFNQTFVDYKENIKLLRTLKENYQKSNPEEQQKILDEYSPLVEKTSELQKALLKAGIAAYQVSNGLDNEIRAFLFSILQWSVTQSEQYEQGYEIAKTVLQYEIPKQADRLYAYGALAAFYVMELDDAQSWYKIAQEKDVLTIADPDGKLQLQAMLTRVMPEYQKLWPIEKEIRAKEAEADDLPRVLFETSKGNITLELFENEAPIAVKNFITLVESGFYNGLIFHRVLPNFMAQGGCPDGTGAGGPGYCIPCETNSPNARMHFRGTLSMAHAGRNTGGSQFFLTFIPTQWLNKQHTVFGRVIDGIDVLGELQRINPEEENQLAPDKIIKATVIRKRPDTNYSDFTKLPAR